jgi:hypothetical protein
MTIIRRKKGCKAKTRKKKGRERTRKNKPKKEETLSHNLIFKRGEGKSNICSRNSDPKQNYSKKAKKKPRAPITKKQ